MIKFILITNDPHLAAHAEDCGVSRIFVDLEKNGKKERQGHLDTLISSHAMSDVAAIKSVLSFSELLVRVNPLHEGSQQEVDEAIESGADLLMLPMFRSADEVQLFVEMVKGRAGVIPLLETYDAAESIEALVKIPGISEIYIGLNDLHLDMKLRFMFEPLANGLVDQLVRVIADAGIPFGFGGIARVGEGVIPGELVLAEHLRLGSSSVILSRTFHRKSDGLQEFEANLNLKDEIKCLIDAGETLQARDSVQVKEDQNRLKNIVLEFVKGR